MPGEVKGFYEAWKKYGKMTWKDLVQPTIDMARNGFPFGYSAHYAATRTRYTPLLKNDPGHRYVSWLNKSVADGDRLGSLRVELLEKLLIDI